MDVQKNKSTFQSLVNRYVTRDGVQPLMCMLETSDFYTAPASTRFHGAEEGGLCLHSINVGNQESGHWEKQPYYKFEEDFSYGGHGDKSVFLVMQYMKLTPEEAAAINAHMGFSGTANAISISDVYNKNVLAWMLHVADEAATYLDKT